MIARHSADRRRKESWVSPLRVPTEGWSGEETLNRKMIAWPDGPVRKRLPMHHCGKGSVMRRVSATWLTAAGWSGPQNVVGYYCRKGLAMKRVSATLLMAVCVVSACAVLLPSVAQADTITVPNTYWNLGTNAVNVNGRGVWENYSNAQWLWMDAMDTSSVLSPAALTGKTITSATLTFANASVYNGASSGTATWSVFAAPGDGSVGVSNSTLSPGGVNHMFSYYATNAASAGTCGISLSPGFGAYTNVTFDITNLVKGWQDSSILHPGMMVILCNGSGQTDASRPTSWLTGA